MKFSIFSVNFWSFTGFTSLCGCCCKLIFLDFCCSKNVYSLHPNHLTLQIFPSIFISLDFRQFLFKKNIAYIPCYFEYICFVLFRRYFFEENSGEFSSDVKPIHDLFAMMLFLMIKQNLNKLGPLFALTHFACRLCLQEKLFYKIFGSFDIPKICSCWIDYFVIPTNIKI